MNEIIVKMADLKIKIKSNYHYMEEFCKDYIIDHNEYDFEVMVDDEAIMKMKQELAFSDEYSESLAIYESIANKLIDYHGFVMHGACIKYQDIGLMFCAPSGTGKSTHIKLWKQYFKDEVDIINGDKPIVRIFDDSIKIYGTPYCGKEGWHKNQSAKLNAICIIKQSKENKIRKLNAKEALIPLFSQIYISKEDEMSALKSMELFDTLLHRIPVYELSCDISFDAVLTCFKGLMEV